MEWKEVRLGDVCEIKGGKRLPKGVNLITQRNSHPYIRVRDLGKSKTIELNSSYEYVDEITQKQIQRYITQKGDILISIVGTIGLIAIVGDSLNGANLTENCVKLVKLDNIDSEYLYYYLKSPFGQQNISRGTVGAVQAKLPIKNIQEFSINCPKLVSDQRRIASILSSLDRKIELNNKINADLEEMAQAIFKNWFVDFEPFKNGKFVNSELGMIPEGWKVSQIADIPHILETGKRPKGGAVEKGIPSVGAEHVKGMCAYDYSKTKYINCEFAAKLKTGKINGYELMIYKDGGKPGYFIPNFSIFGEGYPFENCYLNEHVFKLDFDGNKEFNIFCYFFFKTEQIMSYFNAQGAKAAIPGINKKDVENIYIFSPDNESVIKFGEFAYPLFKQMLKNAIENRTLSTLRDTLLPRLMSGELEVPE